MRTYDLQDLNGMNIRVQMSSLATQAALRIYCTRDAETAKQYGLKAQDECLHLSYPQARIICEALQELMNEAE